MASGLAQKIEKEAVLASERVKSVDVHPTKPWILASLHIGKVCIWDYKSLKMEKSIKVHESSPVRSAKFIPWKNWIVAGADDGFIRVYDYETMEMIKEFEAHSDFVRSIAVHPSLPYILSASDDKLIKLWDWEKGWICSRVFQGHAHYVMQVAFNPLEPNVFASVSLDGTSKVWKVDSPVPEFSLDGHTKGLNCVDFFTVGDKQYVITGSDDFTAKVWDYATKSCVQTLEGHTNNVTAVLVIPELHIIVTCSEDQTIRIWNSIDYTFQITLEYDLQRVWTLAFNKGWNRFVFGCDDGIIVAKFN